MELFNGDEAKIDKLNVLLCEKAGFKDCYSGIDYPILMKFSDHRMLICYPD